MGNSDLFALYIHHGGRFMNIENIDCYVGGECEGTFDLDVDKFGYFDATDLVEKLGYISWTKLWYKIPNSVGSYRVLKCDKEVMVMLGYLSPETRVLHIYVEGGKLSDSGARQNESDSAKECVTVVGTSSSVEPNFIQKLVEDVDFVDWDYDMGDSVDMSKCVNEGEGQEHLDVNDTEGAEGLDLNDGEGEWSDENEDSDYYPCDDESSDDSLDDTELASEDEEYIASRKNVRSGVNVFDLLDKDDEGHVLGYNQGSANTNVESEYESSDGDVCSDSTDDELEGRRNMRFKSSYDPKCKPKNLEIKLGMRFQDGFQCKQALKDNAIANGKFIKFSKVSKIKCQATCRPPCEWRVYGSLVDADDKFVVKTYYPTHTCVRSNNNKLVSSDWIAKKYLNVFRVHPNLPIKHLAEDIRRRFRTLVGKDRLYRARSLAQEMIRGSVEEHYASLRRYVAELQRVDREGTYKLLLGEGAVFKGLYIGPSALRHGFKKSCRPVIGLDGCFLKTYLGGILLCAVGKDGNNQMFPIAWAVVEVENEECWNWFLEIFLDDLAISDGNGWSFISDQQKGLMNAVSRLVPLAEHRNCARHVYMNWKKQHKGTTLKNIFWSTVRSTNVEEYKVQLQEMKSENPAAYEDFIARDVQRFCKAFLSLHSCSDMIDNNISETFNGYILNSRGMHIIYMCEDIRRALMVRQVDNLKKMAQVHHRICPAIMKKLEKCREQSVLAYVYPNLQKRYEVHLDADKFVVDMNRRTCTCRKWELTGIPCLHACSAIHFQCEEPSAYVHSYYTVDRYLEAYKFALEPIVGEKMWPEVEGYKVLPPTVRKLPGRPKKVRRRDLEENPNNPNKLKRFGLKMTCTNCYQKGHNIKTCTNATVPKPAKGKRGRPRKDPSQPPRPQQRKGKEKAQGSNAKERRDPRKGKGIHINEPSDDVSSLAGAKEGPSTQESRNPTAGN